MREFDDLFRKYDDLEKMPPQPIQDPNHDFFEMERENRINRNIVIIYVVVTIVISFFSLFYGDWRFPNPDQIIANVVYIHDLEMTVSEDNENPEYPFEVHITGEIQNLNDFELPSVFIEMDFIDEFNGDIGTYSVSTENLGSLATWTIDETFNADVAPVSFSISTGIDETSMFYMLLNFFQVFIVAILFILIDKSNFRKDWTGFKKKPGFFIGQIVIGYLMVYGALIVSQLLLDVLGVSGTSENESAIASMFSKDVTQLVLLFLLLCVFTPIVEELVFRKAAFQLIERKFGPIVAIVGSGLIFGLMHVLAYFDFIQSIPYIAMGLVFGFVYYRAKKNIYVTIGVHFINNIVAFISYLFIMYGYYL